MASAAASLAINAGFRGGIGATTKGYTSEDLTYDIVISAADVGMDAAMDAGVKLLTRSAVAGLGVTIAFIAVQILLDTLWNPFETKFNKDLETTRKSIRDKWEKELQTYNISYPLTAKPDIWGDMTDDDYAQFKADVKEYFTLHQLVYPAALEERAYTKRLLDLQRQVSYVKSTGDIVTMNAQALQDQQLILDLEEKSYAMLLAAAVLYKRRKAQLAAGITTQKGIEEYSVPLQIGGYLCCIVLLVCCFKVIRKI